MASLHVTCSAALRPARLTLAPAARQQRRLQASVPRRPLPPRAAAEPGGGGGQVPPGARPAAGQQQLEETAWQVLKEATLNVTAWAALEEQKRLNAARLETVAALLGGGLSPTAVVQLLQQDRAVLDVSAQELEPYMPGLRSLIQGVTQYKAGLADSCGALGGAAAAAALAKCPPASFSARCELLGELAAAATSPGGVSRADTSQLVPNIASVLSSDFDAARLRAVFAALQRHLGWSAQVAGRALLGPGLEPKLPDAWPELRETTAEHIERLAGILRQYGMRDDDLAYRTYITRPDWVAIEPCEAEAALATLKATLQFGREPFPAWLWLAVGGAVIDPAFCGTWQQLAQAGVPPDQLQSLAFVYLASGGCEEEPACFAGSLLLLRMLLGSWPAAAEAAAEDPELLGLTLCGLPLKDGEPVPYALAPAPGIDPVLVALELRSLGGGLDEEQLLRLATCALIDGGRRVGAPRALGVLELLGTLFGGSAEAAMEAAAADPALWQLPYDRSAMWAAFDGLGRAGLSDAQLRRLARICCDHADDVGQLSCLAERLYGGDWRAAALEFLRGWRVYVERLCMLPRTLETLEHFDLAVANDAGRQRVLEQVKRGTHIELEVQLPEDTPFDQYAAAAAAALEQQGFRVIDSEATSWLEAFAWGQRILVDELGEATYRYGGHISYVPEGIWFVSD